MADSSFVILTASIDFTEGGRAGEMIAKDYIVLGALLMMIAIPVIELVWIGWSNFREEERKKVESERVRTLYDGEWRDANSFLSMKRSMCELGMLSAQDFTGVYVLRNETKNKYYVGQAKKVLARINSHLSGQGNGDVYYDFKSGDSFSVKAIPLTKSGYESIDKLERDTIVAYQAFDKGYNRTRGNK